MIKLTRFSHDHSTRTTEFSHEFSHDHSSRSTEFSRVFTLSLRLSFLHDHSSRKTEFSLEFFMINLTDGCLMSFHMINRPSFHMSFHTMKSTGFSHEFSYDQIE